MQLHNTLTGQLESLQPLQDGRYRVYSCGPTVYDHAHIGNLSAYIFADTLRRVLANSSGQPPQHVMNYTDVDDKTIRRSHERYPELEPRQALRQLTDHYIAKFRDDMSAVGNDLAAIEFVRATDSVAGMTKLISQLHQQGFAYIADDGVYFSIERYRAAGKQYGQLVHLSVENTSAARINNDEYDKASAHDFALWKTAKPGEPSWAFTLDGKTLDGRPGWHIECSVMSRQRLGQPFDVHTGGIDLQFPHHENEIAQSTALESDNRMAAVFAHNEHILVEGRKMAKSAHNFFTLSDITAKGFDPLAFRLLVLQAHYRSQINFSWEALEAAHNRLQSWRALAALRHQLTQTQQVNQPDYIQLMHTVEEALQQDVATPRALQVVSQVIDQQAETGLAGDPANLEAFLRQLDDLFGLRLMAVADISQAQKNVIQQREAARAAKDWATSDQLRDQLVSQGIGLNDTPQGTIWYPL